MDTKINGTIFNIINHNENNLKKNTYIYVPEK